jgi:hypothetical protein
MLLRHATPARNLSSINALGLLCSKSQGKLPVVWLHSPAKSAWAMLHTVKRHGGRIESVAIVEANVPRRWLRKNRRGLWYCPRDIPPHRFRRMVGFADLARSPVEEESTRRPRLALAG